MPSPVCLSTHLCRNHLNTVFLAASLLILNLISRSQYLLGLWDCWQRIWVAKVTKTLTAGASSWLSLMSKQRLTSKIPMLTPLTPVLSWLFSYQLICKYPDQFHFWITKNSEELHSTLWGSTWHPLQNISVMRTMLWLISCLLPGKQKPMVTG